MPASETPDFASSTQQFDAASARDALPAGTRLGGYQIIDVLGRGSFGIVYLALDSSLQRQVAIKEYLPTEFAMRCEDLQVWVQPGVDVNVYADGKAAFLNEAKLLARFDHPSLARVHSFWEENRTAYMVMSYYAGDTLAAKLAAMPRPPDEAWLRALLTPLLSALSMLHAAECLHLDISPDNILVLDDGRPVLLDLGVANRLVTDKTMRLTQLLNPAYAPIEQYSESPTLPQGPWTDIYALAGVLHFAITGAPPARATVRAVEDPQRPLAQTLQTLQARFPGLSYSNSFLAGIDAALSVKPRDRPRDVTDFQKALDRGVPFAAPVPPTATHSKRTEPAFVAAATGEAVFSDSSPDNDAYQPARTSLPKWVAGSLVVAVMALGAWLWTQWQPQPSLVASGESPPWVAPLPAASAAVSDATPPPAMEAASTASFAAPAASAVAGDAPVASAVLPAPAPAPAATPAPAPVTAAAPAPTPSPVTAAAVPVAPVAPPVLPARLAQAPAAAKPLDDPATLKRTPAASAPAQADTPRATCGSRTNFSLVYCMETQCKRPKFAQHPQCTAMRLRGEIN